MQPLVSIIIPTYNRAHLIGETLDSILDQSYNNWECIVVDDGSTDYTEELLAFFCERDSRIQYHHRPEDCLKGANVCRNYGFELSKGEFINWFDSDDIMLPEKLKIQLNSLLEATPEKDFCVCKTYVFENTTDNILGLRHIDLYSDKPFEDYLKMKIGWMTPSTLWRRSFLLKFESLFDEKLKAAQEWEFHLRALNRSINYIYLDEPLDLIRKHSLSITYNKNEEKRFWRYFLARLKIYRNGDMILNKDSDKFLKTYLLNAFKKMVRERNPYVLNSFWQYLIREPCMGRTAKMCGFLSIWSYRLLNKGNFLMNRISYR